MTQFCHETQILFVHHDFTNGGVSCHMDKKRAGKKNTATIVRKASQIFFFVFIFFITISKWIAEQGIKNPFAS